MGHPPPLRPSGSVSAPLRQVSVAVGLTGTPLTARQPHEALHSLPGPPRQAAHSSPLGTASGPHPVGEGLQSGRLQKCCFPPAEFSSLGHAVSPVHPFFVHKSHVSGRPAASVPAGSQEPPLLQVALHPPGVCAAAPREPGRPLLQVLLHRLPPGGLRSTRGLFLFPPLLPGSHSADGAPTCAWGPAPPSCSRDTGAWGPWEPLGARLWVLGLCSGTTTWGATGLSVVRARIKWAL